MDLKKIKIHYFLRLTIFWLLLFALFRLLFIIYHHAKFPDGEHTETSLAFLYALRLDISTICWLSVIPFIIWSFQQFYKTKFLHLLNKTYIILLISIVSVLSIANIKLYGEWGTQLSARALNYLLYPKEVLHFISWWSTILLLSLSAICIYASIKTYKKYITNFSYPIENTRFKWIQIIVIPILFLVGIRGGVQQLPINESSAYYSTIQINNHIATNNIWYLIHSVVDARAKDNSYVYTDKLTAEKATKNLLHLKETKTESILKVKKPNIVLIILESWTADIIESLGGLPGVTPHFKALEKEGLLFTEMYSSGFRTDQGLISILNGFPAQPNNSIINTPSKSEKLPSLNIILSEQGYHSSFYYGGDIEFANMKSYLLNTRFKKIIDKYAFDNSQRNSKWGAHDEFVFKKQLTDLKNEQSPFFSTVLTLSTHSPFEVPMTTPFTGEKEPEKFKKAAYYADNCLYNYFVEAKKQKWYDSTLFILVADHGHYLAKNRNMNLPPGYKITALITGGALIDSLRGKTVNKICSQHDLPATILTQLNFNTNQFEWSKNIFNTSKKEFAYYSNENVFGWVSTEQDIVYEFASKKTIKLQPKTNKTLNDSIFNQSKRYLQTLYQRYLDY